MRLRSSEKARAVEQNLLSVRANETQQPLRRTHGRLRGLRVSRGQQVVDEVILFVSSELGIYYDTTASLLPLIGLPVSNGQRATDSTAQPPLRYRLYVAIGGFAGRLSKSC